MSQPFARIGCRFGFVDLMVAVECNAWTTGVDQLLNSMVQARFNDVASPASVGAVVVFPRPPNSGYRRNVKHDLLTSASFFNRIGVANVSVHISDALAERNLVSPTSHCGDFIAGRHELTNEVRAEESVCAGDECFHGVAIRGS